MAIRNLTLGRIATANSYVKPYAASRAVDGKFTAETKVNRWLCNGVSAGNAGVLVVDLGGLCSITSWVVRHMSDAGWKSPDYNMCDYKFQASMNGSSWYDLDIIIDNKSGITNRPINTPFAYRYVRLIVTKGIRSNTQFASIMEFEVYGFPTPYLSDLYVDNRALALTPTFSPTIYSYTIVDVPYSTSSVTITPVAQAPNAGIKVNNVAVTSEANKQVALDVDSNTINIEVTSADGTTIQNYSIKVNRIAPVAYLTGFALRTNGEPSIVMGYAPSPFHKDTTSYSTSVGAEVASIVVTPTTDSSSATITVNGTALIHGEGFANLTYGSNQIPIVVTNGTTTKTYTVTVTRATPPPPPVELSGLSINPGSLIESFLPNNVHYTATVGYTVTSITVTPTTNTSDATIHVNNTLVVSGTASAPIDLMLGSANTIDIIVTKGAISKAYLIKVTRMAALTGLNASLVDGATSTPITLSPAAFDRNVLLYTGTMEYSDPNFNTQVLAVTPFANEDTLIKWLDIVNQSGVPLTIHNPSVGDIDTCFVASALNGEGRVAYTVRITRKHSTYLSKIVAVPGTTSPAVTKILPFNYTIKAGAAASTTVGLQAEDPTSIITLTIDSKTYTSQDGQLMQLIPVTAKEKVANVTVTSASGIPSTSYNITIKKF